MASLEEAIRVLHTNYHVPHIIITSVNLATPDIPAKHLCVVGSTTTSQGRARIFKLVFPAFDCYFSGTGDMFSAMMVARMREAVFATEGLRTKASWVSDDSVDALDLPLARAAEKVLGTMHEILFETAERMKRELAKVDVAGLEASEDGAKRLHVMRSRLAELQLVRHLNSLHSPTKVFKAVKA
jgi:pyridoxine kinase